ncbi:MAG TPA: cytochrome P450 [Nitrososphaeraceae archaeon]|nr:cytochrome P450 [Nitrososphaeraceae archaeon]
MKEVNKYPPGPKDILPFTLARKFLRDPLKTLTNLAQNYGYISHFKFGKLNIYFLNHPEYIEDVLVTNHKNFIKSRGLQISKRLLGSGLLTSEGDYHDKQRRLIQPTFYPKKIKSYTEIIIEKTLNLCDNWKEGVEIDIHKEMTQLTLEIICKAVLGYDIKPEEDEIGDSLLTCMNYFNRLLMPFGELIEKIPILPINKGFQNAKENLDSIVFRMIDEHRVKLERDEGKNNDLLFTLLKSQYDREFAENMSDQQLRDEVMTIFLAGHETTANALTWTFYMLSEHPEIDSRHQKEINSIFDNKSKISFNDIQKLEYTTKVLTESMRLYPPAWAIGRQAITDCKIGEYVIASGSIILMSQYVMHRNPLYFPDPNTFSPDRWTDKFKKNLPRFSYFPFGGGIRSCVGEPFAWMESILIIAIINRLWKMNSIPSNKVILKPSITLRPKNGMHLKLTRRI